MATCDNCGTTIVFGGKSGGGLRFCSDRCLSVGQLVIAARQVPADIAKKQTLAVFSGKCPRCKGKGPIDVRMSHSVWSAVFMTSWKSTPHLTCRSCGIKSQAIDAVSSALLGWWGVPWGLLVTPVQIGKNIAGMAKGDGDAPSPELEREVRLRMAAYAASHSR